MGVAAEEQDMLACWSLRNSQGGVACSAEHEKTRVLLQTPLIKYLGLLSGVPTPPQKKNTPLKGSKG